MAQYPKSYPPLCIVVLFHWLGFWHDYVINLEPSKLPKAEELEMEMLRKRQDFAPVQTVN